MSSIFIGNRILLGEREIIVFKVDNPGSTSTIRLFVAFTVITLFCMVSSLLSSFCDYLLLQFYLTQRLFSCSLWDVDSTPGLLQPK